MDSPPVTYQIDLADRITTVNEEWVAFAQANAAVHLLPPEILGSSLWIWIADPTTRQLYQDLIGRVRKGSGPVRFRFRCDAPDQRRLLQMQIAAAADDEVAFETNLLHSQPRSEVRLIDPATLRSNEVLTICGWCMRVLMASETWLEIEEAIPALSLFEATALPRLSHGICPPCYDSLMSVLDNPKLAASGQVTIGGWPSE